MSTLAETLERAAAVHPLFAPLSAPTPLVSVEQAREIADRLFGVRACSVRVLPGDRDKNFKLTTEQDTSYLLKIASAADDDATTDLHIQILRHLARQQLCFGAPRSLTSLSGSSFERIGLESGAHNVWLASYLDGAPIAHAMPSKHLARNLGECLARLDGALQAFSHPAASRPVPWNISNAADLFELLPYVDDCKQRATLHSLLRNFERHIAPVIRSLRSQIIHNDFNPNNVLFDPEKPGAPTGVIDFGDAVFSPRVFEVGIAATYQLLEDDPIDAVIDFVTGYHAIAPLDLLELQLLSDVIGVRLATWSLLARWRSTIHPQRRDHFLRGHERLGSIIGRYTSSMEDVTRRLESIGRPRSLPPHAPRTHEQRSAETRDLVERRAHVVGDALPLFYDEPLHIVRAEGVWVYDSSGRTYLDAYNNVPHVGHCHPRVVAALSHQASILNIHTRYLDANLIDYAERLLSMFPAPLDVCLFTCSGSEATDLALRIAASFTGNSGLVVTEHSYHGSTEASLRASAACSGHHRSNSVVPVRVPDVRSGESSAAASDAIEPTEHVVHAIRKLQSSGVGVRGLVVDPMFTSDGIVRTPEGYLSRAAEPVRQAGGLVIADEIQAGFGRIGHHTWSFTKHGVTPDIVTLGKAIGNGHPMAAVVTRSEVLRALQRNGPYMSTFGGNPVSCAVGNAVLDVLESERLQENARTVGEHLMTSLVRLQERHAAIDDVRGSGLLVGASIVSDRKSRKPAPDLARKIVNAMRSQGILIGVTGAHRNVLKIRPPLVFRREHAELAITQLDDVLTRIHSTSEPTRAR